MFLSLDIIYSSRHILDVSLALLDLILSLSHSRPYLQMISHVDN